MQNSKIKIQTHNSTLTSLFRRRLQKGFFQRDTHTVAKALLGKVLVRRWRGTHLAGRITEVESYVGEDDRACHASRGRTPRTDIMFGAAGHAYVYLIYGMYHCLNIVTERSGFPAAVLIRSLEPIASMDAMQRLRGTDDVFNITTGPGKLAQALAITRDLNGEDLMTSARLFVSYDGYRVPASRIAVSARIGVAYAGACAAWPWRYYLKGSRFVSG